MARTSYVVLKADAFDHVLVVAIQILARVLNVFDMPSVPIGIIVATLGLQNTVFVNENLRIGASRSDGILSFLVDFGNAIRVIHIPMRECARRIIGACVVTLVIHVNFIKALRTVASIVVDPLADLVAQGHGVQIARNGVGGVGVLQHRVRTSPAADCCCPRRWAPK